MDTICKLCLQKRDLISRTHIIPEFLYSSLFDKHHKLNLLAPAEFIATQRLRGRPSSGEYEGGLLCRVCDNEVLGRYETYVHRSFFANTGNPSERALRQDGRTAAGIPCSHVFNFRYAEFKLFLLSMLWRASISTRPFFSDIQLDEHEEVIRTMLLAGDPGGPEDYPILFFSWQKDRNMPRDIIAIPMRNYMDDGIKYVFPIAGITYVFHRSYHLMRPELRPFTLQSSGQFFMFHIPDGLAAGLFASYFNVT